MKKILVVDDEQAIRSTIREILEYEKYEVDEASDGLLCLAALQKKMYDVIILDIKMPKMDGMEALERIQILYPELPVIMASGHGTIEIAVEAVKKGAFDFISKPIDINRLLISVRNAFDRKDLMQTNQQLVRKNSSLKSVNIIGESGPIMQVKRELDKLAPARADVFILGPNGSGKELVARYLHEKSDRANGPLIEVNCAAINEGVVDSELFGHVKGSFTDAKADRIGKFEAANGGTLFLDEIGDMSLDAQSKVLRALENRQITRVGANKPTVVDIRVVAATNKDVPRMIKEGTFRLDLYMRLAKAVVKVPSLNERRSDIPLLVQHFSKKIASEYNQEELVFSAAALNMLSEYNWMGNIRELANVVERLYIYCTKNVTEDDIVKYVLPNSLDGMFNMS